MKTMLNNQRKKKKKNGEYVRAGGVVDPLPDDAPFFVKDYYDYYKTERGYHKRSLNSNEGWNAIGCISFISQPIIAYSDGNVVIQNCFARGGSITGGYDVGGMIGYHSGDCEITSCRKRL